MSPPRSLTRREIIILSILVVVTLLSALSIKNPRQVLMLFPFGRTLAEKETLLDLEEALNRYKMMNANMNILTPKTSMPIIFEVIRPYISPKSRLLLMGSEEYQDLIGSLKAEGIGVEYIFTQYKSAKYPN